MSDIMRPIPFHQLMRWILDEHKQKGTIFGVGKLFKAAPGRSVELFGSKIETPIGPAAGPHTQLAQNIVSAYCAGSRFFELKTVQVLDGEALPVSKPCIYAPDECYNVEWSTELLISDALDEYVKAWIACKVLAKEFGFGDPDGFIFNMSVGYDLAGIQTEKVDGFINRIKDASHTQVFQTSIEWLSSHQHLFSHIDQAFIDSISPHVSHSITLSTLHGCPCNEIEQIAGYLLEEKQLNTFIKCNPTLLGYQTARQTMDAMGYDYIQFDDHHFQNDLQFEQAQPMLQRLQSKADRLGLSFGVKLTNTFPVANDGALPGEEMYMSGKSLFPLSIQVAQRLSEAFDGKLKISFSGGADYFNLPDIVSTGIFPVTLATTLLKPGGYGRIAQLAESVEQIEIPPQIQLDRLSELAKTALDHPRYRKPIKIQPPQKMPCRVPEYDCFAAPCNEACPIHQDVPEYIELEQQGKHLEALQVILRKNPLPFITGTICSHRCMSKCTRNFYEDSVQIRSIKLAAAQNGFEQLIGSICPSPVRTKHKVAVVGGGPAGLAAAYFLAREGIPVTVFEKEQSLGGIVKHVIPEFRISGQAIEKDVQLVRKMGAEIRLGQEIQSIDQLHELGYAYCIWAVGATQPGRISLNGEAPVHVLDFLRASKSEGKRIGKNVAVIGGGNTAMDAARAAIRTNGVENCYIIYRRTKRYMPADQEELELAEQDGVQFKQLLSPVSFADGRLVCTKMKLGSKDASGRCKPVATDQQETLLIDTLIAAVGEQIDASFFEANGICLENGKVKANPSTLETNRENVFVIGDAHRGPSTVVECIQDAQTAANAVLEKENLSSLQSSAVSPACSPSACKEKKGVVVPAQQQVHSECERCLNCSCVCENCVDVCPNRANIAIEVAGMGTQIVHIDSMCNECGNCEMFCPYSSAPYRDKLTLFTSREDFDRSTNDGFLIIDRTVRNMRLSHDIDVKPLTDAIIQSMEYIL